MTSQTNSQVTTYTAEQVHATIAILAVEYMKEWKLNLADEEVIQQKALMEELGFTSLSSYTQLTSRVDDSVPNSIYRVPDSLRAYRERPHGVVHQPTD